MIPEPIVKAMGVYGKFGQREVDELECVAESLGELGLEEHEQLSEFFRAHNLSAVSNRNMYELLDLCSPSKVIEEVTEFGRDVYDLPEGYVCLTSGEGEGFLLYSKHDRKVYDVGVDEFDALVGGKVEANWDSFYDLIEWYLTVERD